MNGNPVALATLLTLPLITVLSTLATVCGENAMRRAALSVMSSWDIVSGAWAQTSGLARSCALSSIMGILLRWVGGLNFSVGWMGDIIRQCWRRWKERRRKR